MDFNSIITMLTGSGHSGLVPIIAYVVLGCTVIDAVFPQPSPSSPWLPFRKLISLLAGAINHASNATQPSLAEWAVATLQKLADAQKPPAPPIPPAPFDASSGDQPHA